MDEGLRQAVAVLAVAMIVAIAARQIRLPYTVGLVLSAPPSLCRAQTSRRI